jgi:hypothetical protein
VAELEGGVLRRTWSLDEARHASGQLGLDLDLLPSVDSASGLASFAELSAGANTTSSSVNGSDPAADGPLSRHLADELACVAGWLDSEAARVQLTHCEGGLALPTYVPPSFAPGPGLVSARR